MADEVSVLVEGGKASAGPPLGPALGPLGVNVGQVVAQINEQTKRFAGMRVPVVVKVNPSTRAFTLVVGRPPVAALLLKEAGKEKGSGQGEDRGRGGRQPGRGKARSPRRRATTCTAVRSRKR